MVPAAKPTGPTASRPTLRSLRLSAFSALSAAAAPAVQQIAATSPLKMKREIQGMRTVETLSI